MKIKFNERSAIEAMRNSGFVDENNIKKTIYDLAKYNFHVKGLDDKQNYKDILKYITEHCPNIIEAGIYKDIDECIRNAKKRDFRMVHEVCITQSELDFIKQLGDIKQEKAAFVMLAVAKYYNALKNTDYDSAFMTHTDICKMARITISKDERAIFMQFAYDKNVLYRHTYASSIVKKLTFISHDDSDPVVLRLKENDYDDLAYTYLAYLTPHKFRRCVSCGRWIRRDSKDRRICKNCSDKGIEEKSTIKEIQCIDCGEYVYVSIHDTETCRCEECNLIYQRKRNALKNKAYRERNKNKS